MVDQEARRHLLARTQTTNKKNSVSRRSVYTESIPTKDDYIPPCFPKSNETFKFLNSSVLNNFIFNSLNDEQRRTLIFAMSKASFPKGAGIIQQGDKSDFFYVVEEGIIEFFVNWKSVGTCGRRDSFGELALLYNCPRAASCIAGTDCVLWRLDFHTFRHILARKGLNDVEDIYKVLKAVPCLFESDKRKIIEMIDACSTKKFKEGERIAEQGKVGNKFHIIREGKVKIHGIGFKSSTSHFVDYTLGPGDFFCERALWNVTAATNCTTMSLTLHAYEKILGSSRPLINCLVKRNILMSMPIFESSSLKPQQFSRLADLFENKSFLEGEFLVEENETVVKQGIYIIINGSVQVINDEGICRTLYRGDYFGESLLQVEGGSGTVSDITIRFGKQSICSVLTKSAMESVIGSVNNLVRPLLPIMRLNCSIKLHDLNVYRTIGLGSFCMVKLASHKKTNKPYALKIFNKHETIQEKRAAGIVRERTILSSIDHPFIVNLVSTFQNDNKIYMLLDFVHGGDLFKIFDSNMDGGIPIGDARFYAACILEALSLLHHHHLCHRNLTAENVLIDKVGYCVLVNFKNAKVIMDKTHTFCGSPAYLAPEIVLCNGHNKDADYWAFGVLIYEMLTGDNPFTAGNVDQARIFKRIVKAKYAPLRSSFGESTDALISGLLSRDQTNRLGHLEGGMAIRKHPWFAFIDFAGILKKEVKAPWKPYIKGDLDPSHYDHFDDFEEGGDESFENIIETKKVVTCDKQEIYKDF